MKQNARYFALAICLLFVSILLAGCSNSSKQQTTEVQAPAVTSEPTATPTVKPTATPTTKPTSVPTKNSSSASSTKTSSGSSSSFTNKYGTPTTKCAHSGCNNYIASSGDTNCCTTHSRRCAECGKYIDEDATYCMDCITKAAGKAAESKGRKCDESGCSNTATKALIVTQPSGESAGFYFCSTHYNQYKSYFNSKKGWKAE